LPAEQVLVELGGGACEVADRSVAPNSGENRGAGWGADFADVQDVGVGTSQVRFV